MKWIQIFTVTNYGCTVVMYWIAIIVGTRLCCHCFSCSLLLFVHVIFKLTFSLFTLCPVFMHGSIASSSPYYTHDSWSIRGVNGLSHSQAHAVFSCTKNTFSILHVMKSWWWPGNEACNWLLCVRHISTTACIIIPEGGVQQVL